MKRLWKSIPPCCSDVLGFMAVINQLDGIGIIDDPSKYKPAKKKGKKSSRVLHSNIRNEDVIRGTEKKVLAAFEKAKEKSPAFVMLSSAPSSAMIGSDPDTYAALISGQGIPACAVKIDGEKDYLYGIGVTLEALGKLLLKPAVKIPRSVNLIGLNPVDFLKEETDELIAAVEETERTVLSVWGIQETSENLKKAASAELNLVVNISGLRLARYMEAEFGIPYIAGSLIGEVNRKAVFTALESSAEASGELHYLFPEAIPKCTRRTEKVVIAGEQFTGNALRTMLLERGFLNVSVISFYDMDKTFMLQGDKKIIGEDDLTLMCKDADLILADPDFRTAANTKAKWIPLPNPASLSPVAAPENFNKFGAHADAWLNTELRKAGF